MNSFALLEAGDENGDDIDQLVKAAKVAAKKEEEAVKVATAAEVKPAGKPAAAAVARPAEGGRGRGGRGEGRGGRGGRGEGRGAGRGEGRGRSYGGDAESGAIREGGRGEGRGEGRGGGRGRGRRGDGEGDGHRAPRREYERHDGTGRGHETEKRGGAGKGNWGAEGDQGEEKPEVEKAEGEEAPAAEDVPEPVEEEKQMSLEEYEAQLAEKKAALNKKVDRKVNVDEEFKGMKAMERLTTEDKITGLELTNKRAEKAAKDEEEKVAKANKKVLLETSFKFDAEPAGGRGEGRGGRGGRAGRGGRGEGRGRSGDRPFSGRGGRGEGRGRGGDRPAPAGGGRGGGRVPVAIDDSSAFPALA